MIRTLTMAAYEGAYAAAENASARYAKQPRRRFTRFMQTLYDEIIKRKGADVVRVSDILDGDYLIIKAKENLGTKKWPDWREAFYLVKVEKVCPSYIKCYKGITNYHVDESRIVAYVSNGRG